MVACHSQVERPPTPVLVRGRGFRCGFCELSGALFQIGGIACKGAATTLIPSLTLGRRKRGSDVTLRLVCRWVCFSVTPANSSGIPL